MKSIFINTKEKTVTETEVDGLESWYKLLECDIVESLKINQYGDRLIIDEEGIWRKDKIFFTYDGARLIGNALILGVNDEGEETPPVITLDEVISKTKF